MVLITAVPVECVRYSKSEERLTPSLQPDLTVGIETSLSILYKKRSIENKFKLPSRRSFFSVSRRSRMYGFDYVFTNINMHRFNSCMPALVDSRSFHPKRSVQTGDATAGRWLAG